MDPKMLSTIWHTYMKLVTKYQIPVMLVFIHIEHICTFFVTFFSATIDDTNLIFGHKLHIGKNVPHVTVCLSSMLQKQNKMNCELMLTYDTPAYMFNVYKNQLSRQTGSRNLKGPKTLPTIWGTYMKLVAFFSVTVDGRNLIFGHKLHIGTPYRGKRF
jgi:hypothetical protein